MRQKIKAVLLFLAGPAVFTVVVNLMLRWLPKALTENAVANWLDEKIAETFGLSSPDASTVLSWVAPFVLMAAILLAYHAAHKRWFSALPGGGDTMFATVVVSSPIVRNAAETEIRLSAVRELYNIVNGPVRDAVEYGHGLVASMEGIVRDHYVSGFLNSRDNFRVKLNTANATLAQAHRKYELYSEVYSDWGYVRWPRFWESFNGFLRVLRTIDSGPCLGWEAVSTLTEPTKSSFQTELQRVSAWIEDAKRVLQ